MKLLVYQCTLKNAQVMENNGCTSLDFDNREGSNDGRDDFDCEIAGSLEVGPEWELNISKDGGLLFENRETGKLIRPTGPHGEGVTTLPRKFQGFKYKRGVDPEAKDLSKFPEWVKLEEDFIARYD